MPVEVKIKEGDTIPQGKFPYIPWNSQLEDGAICGMPQSLSTNDWRGKKVVLISVAGAFTPTCHMNHIPPFITKLPEFHKKGVDVIVILSANDPFIMSAWGRVIGIKDQILFLTDTYASWSKSIGLDLDLSALGLGLRTRRYAMIIDDLVVSSLEFEPGPGVTVTSAEAVLERLSACSE